MGSASSPRLSPGGALAEDIFAGFAGVISTIHTCSALPCVQVVWLWALPLLCV
jgi:hypothetical protein